MKGNMSTIVIDGVTHRVKRVAMSTGKKKFSKPTSANADNSTSVFDKFKDSNGDRHKSL